MNYTPGIILISSSLILILGAYHLGNKQAYTRALYVLILLGLILRIYTASDPFLHKWDERYHALVAKNMMEEAFRPKLYQNPVLEYDYTNWAANHIWVHKQPVPLWSMMTSLKVFGIHEFALRIPSIILSSLLIWLVFLLARAFFTPKIGLIAAFFTAIHGLIIELSAGRVATDHIDIHFTVFIALAIYLALLYHQGKGAFFNYLSALALAFAILSKWLPALIVLPIWLLLGLNNQKGWKDLIRPFSIYCLLLILLVSPWQLYILFEFPKEAAWEFAYNRKHIFEVLGNHSGSLFYYITKIRIQYGELIYLPLLGSIWAFFKQKEKRIELGILLLWFIIPLLFFSLVQTKMKAYLLFVSPSIFIITACFIDYLQRNKEKFRYAPLLLMIQLLLILLPVRYSFERIKPFQQEYKWAEERKERFRAYPPQSIVFNEKLYVEAMFYGDRITVYPFKPSAEQLQRLKKGGYKIIIEPDSE